MHFTLTENLVHDLAVCECCGQPTRAAGGFAVRDGDPWVMYSLSWIPGMVPEHGATLYLSFPAWEGEPMDGERVAVQLEAAA